MSEENYVINIEQVFERLENEQLRFAERQDLINVTITDAKMRGICELLQTTGVAELYSYYENRCYHAWKNAHRVYANAGRLHK